MAAGRSEFPTIGRARAAGSSRYSFGKLLNLAFDGILSFSVLPLRFIFWLGLSSSVLALLGLLFFLLHRIIGFRIFGHTPADVPGFTSLILSSLLVSGVQLLSIGILGEYLGRIYLEVKNRPEYVISRLRPSFYGYSATDQQPRCARLIAMHIARIGIGFTVAVLFAVLLMRNVDLGAALHTANAVPLHVLATSVGLGFCRLFSARLALAAHAQRRGRRGHLWSGSIHLFCSLRAQQCSATSRRRHLSLRGGVIAFRTERSPSRWPRS